MTTELVEEIRKEHKTTEGISGGIRLLPELFTKLLSVNVTFLPTITKRNHMELDIRTSMSFSNCEKFTSSGYGADKTEFQDSFHHLHGC